MFMSDKKNILSSLALDLRRVAQGYFRGSTVMADRFLKEALKRKQEAESLDFKPYIKKLLLKVEQLQFEKEEKQKAEDALMYSTLFQNASLNL